jgi:hypothetical protein
VCADASVRVLSLRATSVGGDLRTCTESRRSYIVTAACSQAERKVHEHASGRGGGAQDTAESAYATRGVLAACLL